MNGNTTAIVYTKTIQCTCTCIYGHSACVTEISFEDTPSLIGQRFRYEDLRIIMYYRWFRTHVKPTLYPNDTIHNLNYKSTSDGLIMMICSPRQKGRSCRRKQFNIYCLVYFNLLPTTLAQELTSGIVKTYSCDELNTKQSYCTSKAHK